MSISPINKDLLEPPESTDTEANNSMTTYDTLQRLAAGMKLAPVAAQAGVNESTVSRCFNGENSSLQVIAAAIDLAGYRLVRKGVQGVDDLAACDRMIFRLLSAQMRKGNE